MTDHAWPAHSPNLVSLIPFSFSCPTTSRIFSPLSILLSIRTNCMNSKSRQRRTVCATDKSGSSPPNLSYTRNPWSSNIHPSAHSLFLLCSPLHSRTSSEARNVPQIALLPCYHKNERPQRVATRERVNTSNNSYSKPDLPLNISSCLC